MKIFAAENGPNRKPVNEELEKEKELGVDRVVGSHLIPKSQRDLRVLAFYLVYAIDRSDYTISLADLVALYAEEFDLFVEANSLAVELADGAIVKRDEFDEIVRPLLKNWKLERLGCCTRIIIRIALFELLYVKTPTSVVINEAVELAKAFAEKDAYKFINGILDEVARLHGIKDSSFKDEVVIPDLEEQEQL